MRIITVLMMTVALFVSNAPVASANTCYDGRFCECRRYLGQNAYQNIKGVVECLTEFGVQHDFSQGMQTPVTQKICEFYSPTNIIDTSLRKCAYRKAGYIVNVNGVEQWNLELFRNNLIRSYQRIFSSPNDKWILDIFVQALRNCAHNPTDFESLPFYNCLIQAEAWVRQNLNSGKDSVQSLSADTDMGGKLLGISSKVDKLMESLMPSPDL